MSRLYTTQEAEMAVVGAVLLHPGAYDQADLRPDQFLSLAHREIWRVYGQLLAEKRPIDVVLVEERLGEKAKAVGGMAYLSELAGHACLPDIVGHYADVVRKHWQVRELKAGMGALRELDDPEEIQARLYRLLGSLETGRTARAMSDLVPEVVRELHANLGRKERGERVESGLPTGLDELDSHLGGGLQPGNVTILGGRPASGKSSLARQIAGACADAGYGVHVFSPEDRSRIYTLRTLAERGRVALKKLMTAEGITKDDLSSLLVAADQLKQHDRWLVDDESGLSSSQIASRVRRHIRENKTRLVVVDYIQKLREPAVRKQGRRAEIDEAIQGLELVASHEGVAMLVLSQLTRENEREGRRPRMSDLRESGELEQHARAILFTHWYEDGGGERRHEILIAKQNHGEANLVLPVHFHGPTTTFWPLSRMAPSPTADSW